MDKLTKSRNEKVRLNEKKCVFLGEFGIKRTVFKFVNLSESMAINGD